MLDLVQLCFADGFEVGLRELLLSQVFDLDLVASSWVTHGLAFEIFNRDCLLWLYRAQVLGHEVFDDSSSEWP